MKDQGVSCVNISTHNLDAAALGASRQMSGIDTPVQPSSTVAVM